MPAGQIVFAVCAVFCVVGEIAILRSAIKTSGQPLAEGSTRIGELVWGIIPAVALAVLLVATYSAVSAR